MLPEATLIQLLLPRGRNLDKEVEETCVLGVNALAFTGYVTAEHFLVSFWALFHRPSFLSRVAVLRLAP
jgi:hypothetical protein